MEKVGGHSDPLDHQKQHLRFDCIYLKKVYEIAIQNMNSWTWKQCAEAAIAELNDAGFSHIKNEVYCI